MSAAAPKLAPATLDDLLALPEELRRRRELIDGALVERGAAGPEHGRAQFSLARLLGPYNRRPGGIGPGGWWFATEVDIFFDSRNTLRPDVLGWRRDRVPAYPKGYPVEVLPDWTCEILSTNRRNDLVKKKRVYYQHRVPHYWILDPAEGTLSVHRFIEGGYQEILSAERGERVRAEPFADVELSVGLLLGEEEEEAGQGGG